MIQFQRLASIVYSSSFRGYVQNFSAPQHKHSAERLYTYHLPPATSHSLNKISCQTKNQHPKAVLALLALALMWGYNWVQMKVAVHYSPPFVFAAMRIFLGAVSLFLAMVWLRKPLLPKEIRGTFWVGILQITGVYGLTMWALVSGGAGKPLSWFTPCPSGR